MGIKSVESVNWESLLNNETVHRQLFICDETKINTFSNFECNKLVAFYDPNSPLMNNFVESKINGNTKYTKLIKRWSHIQ